MKLLNVKLLLLMLAAATLVFTSCSKDDKDEDPKLTIDQGSTPTDRPLKPNDPIVIKFSANKGPDGKNLAEVRVEFSADGSPFTIIAGNTERDLNVANLQRTLNFTARNISGATGTDAYRITVVDRDGKSASRTLTYNIARDTTQPVDKTPKAYSNVTLNNTQGFFSTQNGQRYNNSEAQANASLVDITFFFSGTSGNNLASAPARSNSSLYGNFAINWGVVGVEYRTTNLTSAQFNALNDVDNIKPAFDAGQPTQVTGGNPPGSRITEREAGGMGGQFRQGNVIAFKTGLGNKHGLILINSVAPNENGSASISIKMEK
jgi:hypothetical protein